MKNIRVRVVTKASRLAVKDEAGIYKVYLTQPACDGLANKQLISVLSDYLKVKKYQLHIIRGEKSRDKVVSCDTRSDAGA